MLAPARSPLGAPGVYALPDAAAPSLHPERMDVCAFAGVAPRGPARVPLVDAQHADGWSMVADARPLRHALPVPVRSFDEYLQVFGGFEGPGLLPHAVASYFEQGGRLAWVLRIVPQRAAPFGHRCAQGWLRGAFTADLPFLARSEGSWGRQLQLKLAFSTTPVGFTLGPGNRLELDPRSPVQPGATLRLTDAAGQQQLSLCLGLARVRDAQRARERLVPDLDPPPAGPPRRVDLVEAVLDLRDHQGRRERFEHLALVPDHPASLASVLCRQSTLAWPHPDWAGQVLTPPHPRVELITATSEPFSGGDDAWQDLTPSDFFDPDWSPAEDAPARGLAALAALDQITQLVVPDLYLPALWAGPELLPALPAGTAGAEFGDCVQADPQPAIPSAPPSVLTGLVLDPRTEAGLDQIATLQQRLLDFCEGTQNLVALLDVPPGLSQARIEAWRARFDSSYAAAYHPWLVPGRRQGESSGALLTPAAVQQRRLPPSAVAAGIIARRELERGLQVGPANEIARQVIHLAEPQPEGRVDALHPLHVNCFMREPLGIALVAARTLSRDPDWRQLSVRRLLLMLRRTLLAQTQWAVFEPNGPRLWRDLQRAIESLLRQLFRAGAFAGRSESDSFFVRLLTEPARLDRGELVVEIGVAPAEPLEFILVRLRRDGDGTLNLET